MFSKNSKQTLFALLLITFISPSFATIVEAASMGGSNNTEQPCHNDAVDMAMPHNTKDVRALDSSSLENHHRCCNHGDQCSMSSCLSAALPVSTLFIENLTGILAQNHLFHSPTLFGLKSSPYRPPILS